VSLWKKVVSLSSEETLTAVLFCRTSLSIFSLKAAYRQEASCNTYCRATFYFAKMLPRNTYSFLTLKEALEVRRTYHQLHQNCLDASAVFELGCTGVPAE